MITFDRVTKTYPGGGTAVKDLSLAVEQGELVCLIGPSGCGKTTSMKMINRLVEPTSGTIKVGGRDIQSIDPVELRRGIGYVIQQIGLFPHMTIAENIGLVPRLLGWEPERRRLRVNELLPLVDLDPATFRERYPRELSGGQQQRVGVLRALAAEPEIILMDEPFGALDPITRESLQDELKRLQSRVRKTIVFVTHDMDEALKLADRIVVMRQGEAVQVATPEELLRNPANEFVATFIGRDRLVSAPDLLTVAEVMVKGVVTADPDHGLAEAVATMRKKRVDSLVITDGDGRLLGIVTAREIEKGRLRNARTVEQVMLTNVPAVNPDDPVKVAFERMLMDRADFLPVVDGQNLIKGLVTRTSLVDALSKAYWGGVA